MTPRRELWATLSVRDHCRPGAFVPEVLTYDKLVIPVPPTEEDGLAPDEARAEWVRWEHAGWQPERQGAMLEILGERAVPIPWTQERQAEWREAMCTLFADARRDGYFMSGSVLQRFAPAMAQTIVAVSQFHSLDVLKATMKMRARSPDEKLPAGTLVAVLGHELLLPEVVDVDDLGVLEDAVAVAEDPDYRARRRALFEWQEQFVSEAGLTDARSIASAVAEMVEAVEQLKQATARQRKWKFVRRCLSFLRLGSSAAGLVPTLATPAKGVGVIASVGSYVIEEYVEPGQAGAPVGPAATLFMDAREKLEFEG